MFVRVHAPHRALTTGGVTMVVFDAAQRAGLAKMHAHRLRHTAATAMLRAGSPLAEVGQVLRHRSRVDHGDLRQGRPGRAGRAGPALAGRRSRRCVMTGPLRDQLADYLALRRALGYRLARPEKLLGQFLDHLEQPRRIDDHRRGGAGLGAAAGQRRLELVGLPAVGGARLRHLPARARPGARGARRRICCRSGRCGPARTCIPTPRSPR